MNIWMIRKNSRKHSLLQSLKYERYYWYYYYAQEERICKDFEIKDLGKYHDLYVQSDTLLLAYVFENIRNTCLKIYKLDPAKFLSSPGLAWEPALKKTKVKLDPLTDINVLLMVEKGLWRGICYSIYRYNSYGWEMLQTVPVNNFDWTKHTSQFNKDFIKDYNEERDDGYFLKVYFEYLEES